MAIISVDYKLLKQSADTISDLSKKMNVVSSSLESINFNSFLEIKASSSLSRKISACNTEVEQYVKSFRGLSTTLTSIASLYEKTERGLLGFVYNKQIGDAALKNLMKIGWDVLDTGIDILLAPAKLIKAYYTDGPAGLAKEEAFLVYDLYEDVAKIGSHLTGLALAGIGGVTLLFGNTDLTSAFIEKSVEASEVDSASDAAGLSGDEDMQKFLKTVETAHDAYEVVDDIDSFIKDPKKMISGFIPEDYKELKTTEYFDALNEGKSYNDRLEEIKSYKKLYDSYGKQETSYKYIKWGNDKLKNLVETGTSDSQYKEEKIIFNELKNIKGIKTASDIKDLFEDGKELLEELVAPTTAFGEGSLGGGGFRESLVAPTTAFGEGSLGSGGFR